MRPLRWISWLRFALCLACLPMPAVAAAEQAGVAAAVRGQVTLARAQIAARAVASGEGIFMQDSLRSGPSSGMQLLLRDETVFTIGPLSELVVDEFVYDSSTSAGKVGATVAKGVFRFVTGRIAHRKPSDMNVQLPAGNIGVRGTIVAGRVDDVTRASLVILLGDSRGEGEGGPASIEVCNAGVCRRVATPGFGVRIDGPQSPPSPPFRVASEELDGILQAVSNPEGIQANGSTNGADQLGETTIPGSDDERERDIRRRLRGLNAIDGLSDQAAQDARGTQVPNVPQPQTPTIAPPTTGGANPTTGGTSTFGPTGTTGSGPKGGP